MSEARPDALVCSLTLRVGKYLARLSESSIVAGFDARLGESGYGGRNPRFVERREDQRATRPHRISAAMHRPREVAVEN